jgi:RES domain-containing protein
LTAQILDRVLTCWRIGDPGGKYPIFDATGSTRYPGRWNTASSPVIYASEHYALAMLEKLAHGSGAMPPNQHYIRITVPNGLSYEVLDTASLPDWAHPGCVASRPWGERWQRERRSAVLLVPSVVARVECNVLINPQHPQFPAITHGLHQPVWWDARLFG